MKICKKSFLVKVGILFLSFFFTISSFGQTNLVMTNNSVWPDDYTPQASYDYIEMGNSSIINVYSSNTLTVNQNLIGNNNNVINVTGQMVIMGDMIFDNNSSAAISGNIVVYGNATFGSGTDLTIDGDLQVSGNFSADANSTIEVDGTLNIAGDFTAAGNTVIDGVGEITIDGNATIANTTTIGTGLTINNSVLPVELLSFTAEKEGGNVLLSWSTASEVNNDYFTIEKSYDYNNWEEVTFVNGMGNTNQHNYYSYQVNSEDAKVYYRLKQTDFDGAIEYVGVLTVVPELSNTNESLELISLETASGQLQLVINSGTNTIAKLVVYNLQGCNVYDSNTELAEGATFTTIPANIGKGMYVLNISNGFKTITKKIVIQ